MSVPALLYFLRTKPFESFTIKLFDGREFEITDPEKVTLLFEGREVASYDLKDERAVEVKIRHKQRAGRIEMSMVEDFLVPWFRTRIDKSKIDPSSIGGSARNRTA
jgi:hypothetical protein